MAQDKQTPYVAHPVRVMMIVCRDFGVMDETILSASVLHDIIEDTTRDYESISFHFGTQVADLVAVLSKDPRLPEPVREASYDDQLRSSPWAARLIKLADCLDNFQDALDDTMQSRAREKAIRALELVQPDDPPAAPPGRRDPPWHSTKTLWPESRALFPAQVVTDQAVAQPQIQEPVGKGGAGAFQGAVPPHLLLIFPQGRLAAFRIEAVVVELELFPKSRRGRGRFRLSISPSITG
ncbi:MAG: HD domain-containing protein [Planctomycetaceae bacterium]